MAERLQRMAAWLDLRPSLGLAGLTVLYLAVSVAQACWKLLWTDELITFYIAQRPGLRGIWQALVAGADPNPPLLHVLVKISVRFFGVSALAIRLPSICFGLVAILAMWWMLRQWVRPVFCLGGILAFMATRGFDYSYDARSYALLMGCGMLALALWVRSGAVIGSRLFAMLCGLAIALAAGLSANYYGVLAFFPVAAGELVRQVQARRLRIGVWLAMLAGASPLIAYLPLIRHNVREFAPHAWNRTQANMISESYLVLVEGVVWPVLALALIRVLALTGFALRRRPSTARVLTTPRILPDAERVALGVLLAYPLLGYAVARGGAGIISARCVVPVCCGFGLAAGVLMEALARSRMAFGTTRTVNLKTAMIVLTTTFFVWVGVREAVCTAILGEQRHAFLRLTKNIERAAQEPLAVADSSLVLPLYFYGDTSLKSRIFVPIDFDRIHRIEADDSGEQNLWGGRQGVFPFPVIPLALETGRWTLVLGKPEGWLARSLEEAGYTLSIAPEQAAWGADWDRVGGVFSPMAHPETRLLRVAPKQ